MNFFLLRDGKKQGPHPLTSMPEMRRYGGVLDTDEILVDGAPGWVRVSDYLPARDAAAPPPLPAMSTRGAGPAGGPPPLPQGSPARAVASDELIQQVEAGGRFVLYTYCISILVMTFRRGSEVTFLTRDKDGAGDAIKYSAISALLGWWGIPWGPIWTIGSLITNAGGGKDVTREVLVDRYGADAAAAILLRRQKPAPAGMLMKSFRVALVAVPLLLLSLFVLPLGAMLATGSGSSRTLSAFDAANKQINVNHGQAVFGNSEKAIAVAGEVSRSMKRLRELGFEGGKKNGLSVSQHEFLTYCDLREGQCIVLVHVPELRRFTADAKDSLAELAWSQTQAALRGQNAGAPGMKVVVGMRGIALYDRAITGQYVAEAGAKDNASPTTVKDGRDELKAAFE